MTRSILAGVAGFACWSVLWLTENEAVLALLPGAPADGSHLTPDVLLVLIACAIANSTVAGALTSAIARRRPRPVWGLATALLGFGIFVQAGYWELMPVWYHLSFLAVLVPATLLGGAFARHRGAARAMPAAS